MLAFHHHSSVTTLAAGYQRLQPASAKQDGTNAAERTKMLIYRHEILYTHSNPYAGIGYTTTRVIMAHYGFCGIEYIAQLLHYG